MSDKFNCQEIKSLFF